MSARWTQADVDAANARAATGIVALKRGAVITGKVQQTRNGNISTDGFASKREANRFGELMLLELAGTITNLRNNRDHKAECTFELIPAQYIAGKCVERACKYIADFVYETAQGVRVVEDAKGYRESVYRIKRKLMLHIHGISILET